ncbi:hypothetical protein CVT26_015964 [Gymnopilus dilepis]|uniref:Uncharacterized protein n=1 Tax=Gymnopilus dilepis TaxID=231916 RepID=A0A409XYI8_9AGAR|nr:hypothetical protein CVT26_015964 [Gymnopilus dilepis]
MPPYPGFEFATHTNLGLSDNTITPQDASNSQFWATFDELVSSPPYPPANETETRFYLDPSHPLASASPLSPSWSKVSNYQAGEPSFDLHEFSVQPQGYHMDPATYFGIGERPSSSSLSSTAPSPPDFSATVYAPDPYLPAIQPPPLSTHDVFQHFQSSDRSVDDMLREEFFRLPADMQEEYFLSPHCRDLMMALFPRLTRLIASNHVTHTTQWPSYDCYGTSLAPTAAEDHALGRSGGASKRTRRFRGIGQNQTEEKKRRRAREEARRMVARSHGNPGSSLREAERQHKLKFNQALRTGYGPSSRADPVERAETHPQRSSRSHGSTSRKTKAEGAGRPSASESRRSQPAPSGVADCLTWKPSNQYTIPSGPTPPIPFFDGRITKTTRIVGDHEVRIDRVDGRFLGVSVK